jgi:hypothetical protein
MASPERRDAEGFRLGFSDCDKNLGLPTDLLSNEQVNASEAMA